MNYMPVEKFYGKYRGKVVNNLDPDNTGRIQVSVPDVLGTGQMSWAMPSVPYAGPNVGFHFIPPVDANVWVEFEGGNLEYPIWTGCFWNSGDCPLPTAGAAGMKKMLKTDTMTLEIDEIPGGGTLKLTYNNAEITIGPTGIKIDNGTGATIEMQGPRVAINGGTLEILG